MKEPMNLTQQFIAEISICRDPVMFLGLAHLFKVELVEDDKEKDFTSILDELLKKYDRAPRKLKRDLLRQFKKANEQYYLEEKALNAEVANAN